MDTYNFIDFLLDLDAERLFALIEVSMKAYKEEERPLDYATAYTSFVTSCEMLRQYHNWLIKNMTTELENGHAPKQK